MKKEMGKEKLIVLTILAIFLFSFIATIVLAAGGSDPVNAEANQQAAVNEGKTLQDQIKGLFTGPSFFTMLDTTKASISKLLLMFLVVLLVYSVIGFIFEGDVIKWAASIAVGLLSFLFVSADNIKYILTNYEALGIVLTSILPFIIIVAFTMKFREAAWTKKDAFTAAMSGFIVKLIICGFIAYVGIKWAILSWGIFGIKTSLTQMPELFWLYPITLAAAIVWLFIEKRAFRWISKDKLKIMMSRAHESGKLSMARQKDLEWQEKMAAARTKQEREEAEKQASYDEGFTA